MKKQNNNSLFLSILATTLVSGVAVVWAWVGPTGGPLVNNVAAPINSGTVAQSKASSLTTIGVGSTGNNIFTGSTMLGGATAPRAVLEVNGNIVNTAALNSNSNLSGYNLGVGTIGAGTSIYSYGAICSGNASGICDGASGTVIGTVNTAAVNNIPNSGTTFFNGGNVGIGTTGPGAKLQVSVAPNSIDGVVVSATDGRFMRMAPSPGAGSWNGLVQAGDQSLIFSNGTSGTGNLVIAPWAVGTTGLRITSAGNVGIGTSTPASTLGVQGAITAAGTIRSSTGGFSFPDGTTQTTAAAASQWTTSGANIFSANAGNVGVGTASPVAKMHINGTAGVTALYANGVGGANLYIDNAGAGSNYLRGNTYFNGALYDETNSTYYLDPSGNSVFANTFSDAYYDRNNNGYYVDGNNTSILNSIQSRNFIDLDNTGYYVDGNNTSVFNAINAIGYFLTDNAAPTTYFKDTDGRGAILHNNSNQFYILGTPTANSTGFGLNGSSYPLVIDLTNDNMTIGGNVNLPEGTLTTSGAIQSASTIRSTAGGFIFPDGSTQITAAAAVIPGNFIQNQNTAAQSANAWISGSLTAGNLGVGVSPVSAKVQVSGTSGVTALQVNGVGAGNLFIDWNGSGVNYLRGNTYFNGVLYDETGGGYSIDPSGQSNFNDLRSNFIYDSNDTNYYLDMNSVSYLNDIRPNVIYDRNDTNFYLNPNGGSRVQTMIATDAVYASNWFRSYGGTGWYNETYGTGIYSDEGGFMRGYGATGLKLYGALSAPSIAVSGAGTFGGNVTAPAFIYSSDRSLKDNISRIATPLEKVRVLEGYTFNWKKDGRADVGLIAQQVETVFPELVHTDSITGLKAVEYGNLVAPLIEAVKELATMFDSLAQRVFNTEVRQTELEKQNALQAEQIAELQRQIAELNTKR